MAQILQQRLVSFPGLRTKLDGDKPGVSVFTTGQPDVVVRGTGGLGIVVVKQITIPIFMHLYNNSGSNMAIACNIDEYNLDNLVPQRFTVCILKKAKKYPCK